MNLKFTILLPFPISLPLHFSFLFLFVSSSEAAHMRTMDEHNPLEMAISREDLTRIKVKGDRIQNVFGNTGEYVLETDDVQGQIFLRPSHLMKDKSISLTLTTESGKTQDLRLIPKDQTAEALLLNPPKEIEEEILIEKKSLVSKEEVETLISSCKERRLPRGYKSVPPPLKGSPEPYPLVQEMKGETLRCLTYEVSNPAVPSSQDGTEADFSHAISLNEELFARSLPISDTDLIAISMKQHTLHPGEKTNVYVVARAH